MNYTASNMWHRLPPDLPLRLVQCLSASHAPNVKPVPIFFRADDIGVPGRQFKQMIDIFARHKVPLNLAVVPSWLTKKRWQQLLKITADNDHLWCWHQHGRSHKNHQKEGKKGEFGSDRSINEISYDLSQGQKRLREIMQNRFAPIFTPPWNRCSTTTVNILKELGFKAISRSTGKNIAAQCLPDFPVSIDLHTRKEADPQSGWENLFAEIQTGVKSGSCGIMLHHQRMNDNAYCFLDTLLALTQKKTGFELLNFSNMLNY